MKFAKVVFWVAGIYGVLVITPLYFLFDRIGRENPPPITHPGFYYGFVGVALAWQLAFLVIATDPARYRLLMLPSIFEKVSAGGAIVVLVLQGRTATTDLTFAVIDLLLGVLFLLAFFKTRPASSA
jgi:hypothetical protein